MWSCQGRQRGSSFSAEGAPPEKTLFYYLQSILYHYGVCHVINTVPAIVQGPTVLVNMLQTATYVTMLLAPALGHGTILHPANTPQAHSNDPWVTDGHRVVVCGLQQYGFITLCIGWDGPTNKQTATAASSTQQACMGQDDLLVDDTLMHSDEPHVV